jgi:hypothetical protein
LLHLFPLPENYPRPREDFQELPAYNDPRRKLKAKRRNKTSCLDIVEVISSQDPKGPEDPDESPNPMPGKFEKNLIDLAIWERTDCDSVFDSALIPIPGSCIAPIVLD